MAFLSYKCFLEVEGKLVQRRLLKPKHKINLRIELKLTINQSRGTVLFVLIALENFSHS